VSIFTSGTRVKCYSCKLPFVVQRPDSVIADPDLIPAKKPEGTPPVAPPSDSDTKAGEAGELAIPGYQLFEILGKGGMGRVYRAMQVSLNRTVAIKVLNEDLAKHKSFIRRFEKEAGALASQNHPNITAIFDRGHVGQTYYFVMEYVAGPSLRHLINKGRMEIPEVIQHVVIMCGAMGHAHKRNVIHRDLKPENVLFTEDGVLKVADFGLANIVAPDRRWELTRTQVSMGTVNYMAPEQRRDAKHVDHLADIYSLGVMFYEMLCRELPLGRFQPPSKRREGLDPRIDDLVMRMLDVDPDRRPQNAELIAAQLESIFGRIHRAAVHAVPQAARVEKAQKPIVEEAGSEERPISTVVSEEPRPAKEKPKPAKKKSRIPRLVALLVGGLTLLALAAVGVVTLLMFSNLGNTPGDLDLRDTKNGIQMKVTHPRRVKYLSPASVRNESNQRVVHFDFLPSTMPVVSVAFIGGSWETERGKLVQDTCRTGPVVNQVPARALFGEKQVSPEGVEIVIQLEARQSTWRAKEDDAEEVTVEEYLKKNLGGVRSLVPMDIDVLVGLGILNKESKGLEVRLPLSPDGKGQLIRTGEMEGEDKDFPLQVDENFFEEIINLKLSVYQGRVQLIVGERLVLDELAGFPLGFKGHPSIACQNAKCTFQSVEYTY
jgi:serine/threonine protein kinase